MDRVFSTQRHEKIIKIFATRIYVNRVPMEKEVYT